MPQRGGLPCCAGTRAVPRRETPLLPPVLPPFYADSTPSVRLGLGTLRTRVGALLTARQAPLRAAPFKASLRVGGSKDSQRPLSHEGLRNNPEPWGLSPVVSVPVRTPRWRLANFSATPSVQGPVGLGPHPFVPSLLPGVGGRPHDSGLHRPCVWHPPGSANQVPRGLPQDARASPWILSRALPSAKVSPGEGRASAVSGPPTRRSRPWSADERGWPESPPAVELRGRRNGVLGLHGPCRGHGAPGS